MSLYKRPDSDVWWVSISIPGQPRVREPSGSTDRTEALKFEASLKAKLWNAPKALSGFTWGRAVDAWLDVEPRSESELLSLRKFSKQFPDRLLERISGNDIEQALSFCQTAGTYTRYRTMIVAVLNLAKKRKWLSEVPDIPVRKDKKPKTREWLTHEQWDKLYAELPGHLKAPALFAISTGLRQANVFGLRWANVELSRRAAFVVGADTKAGKAISVPLNDEAVAALQAVEGQHEEFVFTYRGRPILKPKTGFDDACVRAGVRDFSWHGFRHTWASWHIQNGTPIEVLQRLGGWSDLRMVMNYAHHSPGHLAGYANNVRKK